MSTITVYVGGEQGTIDAQALVVSVDAVLDMLRSVSETSQSPARISNLQSSSLVIEVSGVEADIDCVAAGIPTLRTGSLPPGWNEKTLKGVLQLEKVSQLAGVSGVKLTYRDHTEDIDSTLAQRAREVEEAALRSLGTLTGRLYSYTNRHGNRPEAKIHDESTNRNVTLNLGNQNAHRAIELLEKRVTVRGIKTYDPWRQTVTSMEVLGISDSTSTRDPQMTLEKGRGLLKDSDRSEADGVALVRKLRDAS